MRISVGRYLQLCLMFALLLTIVSIPTASAWGGTIALISQTQGGIVGNDYNRYAQVSADGRFVVFQSDADNLVPNDTNGFTDVFLKDVETGALTLLSRNTDGNPANGISQDPSISADGQYIAFVSTATDLNSPVISSGNVYRYERTTNLLSLVSTNNTNTPGNGAFSALQLNDNGRFLMFRSNSDNLVSGDTNGAYDVFVKDIVVSSITRVSVATGGVQLGEGSENPAMSDNGRYITFASSDATVVANDTNGMPDVFRHDRNTGITERVSVANDGAQLPTFTDYSSVSNTGTVVFANDSSLAPQDTNNTRDIYLRNPEVGTTSLVSAAFGGTGGNDFSYIPDITADGRYVAFLSSATNFAPGANPEEDYHLFVKDLETGFINRMDEAADDTPANSDVSYPAIASDGTVVVFESNATNLTPDNTNNEQQIFHATITFEPTAVTVSSWEVMPESAAAPVGWAIVVGLVVLGILVYRKRQ